MKLNNLDKVNAQIRQQLLNLAKISTDVKKDLDNYKKEYFQNKEQVANGGRSKTLSSK